MKITLTIEATPEEVREALGLPNMQGIQKEILTKITDQVQNGEYDLNSLAETMIPKSFELGKKFIDLALGNLESSSRSAKKSDGDE